MAKIFWATCPKCGREFCAVRELLIKNLDIRCPYCKTMFKPTEAGKIAQ